MLIFVIVTCFGACGYWRRRQWAINNGTTSSLHLRAARQHRLVDWHQHNSDQNCSRVAMTVVLSPTCPCDSESRRLCRELEPMYPPDKKITKPPPTYAEVKFNIFNNCLCNHVKLFALAY